MQHINCYNEYYMYMMINKQKLEIHTFALLIGGRR